MLLGDTCSCHHRYFPALIFKLFNLFLFSSILFHSISSTSQCSCVPIKSSKFLLILGICFICSCLIVPVHPSSSISQWFLFSILTLKFLLDSSSYQWFLFCYPVIKVPSKLSSLFLFFHFLIVPVIFPVIKVPAHSFHMFHLFQSSSFLLIRLQLINGSCFSFLSRP